MTFLSEAQRIYKQETNNNAYYELEYVEWLESKFEKKFEKDYVILSQLADINLRNLEEQVSKYIKNGYLPLGGPFVSNKYIHQAMYRGELND